MSSKPDGEQHWQSPKSMYIGQIPKVTVEGASLAEIMREALDAPGEVSKLVIIPMRKIESFSSNDVELIKRHLKLELNVDSVLVSPEEHQAYIQVPISAFPKDSDMNQIRRILMEDFFKLSLRLSVRHSVLLR